MYGGKLRVDFACDNVNRSSPIYLSFRVKPLNVSPGSSERLKTVRRGQTNTAEGRVKLRSPFFAALFHVDGYRDFSPTRWPRLEGFFLSVPTVSGARWPGAGGGRRGGPGPLPAWRAWPASVELCAGLVQNPAFGWTWEAVLLVCPFWRNPKNLHPCPNLSATILAIPSGLECSRDPSRGRIFPGEAREVSVRGWRGER